MDQREGRYLQPALHYYVGGNSKVYGAALFRLRERDFDEVVHAGGVSPAWPLKYDAFERYHDDAEALFHVHGQRGEDPLEPSTTGPYPYAAVPHEPKVAELSDKLAGIGLKPFHLPLAILLGQKEDGSATRTSVCMRCSYFDGFPCLLNGKADAQVVCIDPTLAAHANVTLLTGAFVERLDTDATGRRVEAVRVRRNGRDETYAAGTIVVACGALSSALLLLRSANDRHPNGLANGSDQVGRNYMRHNMSIVVALMKEVNETVFQKTLALSDSISAPTTGSIRSASSRCARPAIPIRSRARNCRAGSSGCRTCRSTRSRGIRWISGCRPRTCRIRTTGSTTGTARCTSTCSTPPPKR